MRGSRRLSTWAVRVARVVLALIAIAGFAHAQADSPADAQPDKAKLERAKDLFRKGNELRNAGDCERALEYYRQSRELVASTPNTMNAAACLDDLKRYDEALELYEELLTRFGSELTLEERQSIGTAMRTLRRRIGSVDVSSNVDGIVVIDGRTRGRLPLAGPIRVMPGRHRLRIMKDGFGTFEQVIDVSVGQSVTIDAKLIPLVNAGRLRVQSDALVGAELTIDGAKVGVLPWEGTLAPGPHVYWVRRGNLGSAPKIAKVLQGQTLDASVVSAPLGPEIRIVAEPPTAELFIDGVPIGRGPWLGALPRGSHTLEAQEPGYQSLSVRRQNPAGTVVLSLQIDRSHPRWAPEPSLWVEALGGLALAPSLRSGAERSCDQFDCSNDGLALGGLVGLRGGYELPIRIAFELSAGYFGIQKSFSRTIHERFGGPKHDLYASTYELRDKIRILGPFAAAGVSYRRPLGTRFSIAAAVSIGVLYLASRDRIDGTGSAGGQTLDVYVIGSDELRRSGNLFAMPELRIGANFGRVEVGLGLAAGLFLLDGPKYPTSDLTTGAECGTAPLDTIQCAPGEDAVREERAYGRFFAAMPMARVRYTF